MFPKALAILALLAASVAAGDTGEGGTCKNDSDCAGNLDCIRTSLFSHRCFAVSCAKGAAHAVIESGFNAKEYVATIRGKGGLRSNRDIVSLLRNNDATGGQQVMQAMKAFPPPREVFESNYTACLNPERRLAATGNKDGTRGLQTTISSTRYGLMWSLAGAFSYFGKSTWSDEVLGRSLQIVSNCVGGILGGDIGLDFLIQIFDQTLTRRIQGQLDDAANGEQIDGEQIDVSINDWQFIPVITLGPIGVQVGWDEERGPDGGGIITEVTLGASLGAAAGGFNQCFNEGMIVKV